MKKKLFRVVLCVVMAVVFLAGCGKEKEKENPQNTGNGHLIGISMPNRDQARWIKEGNGIKGALEDAGYSVDLQFAEGQSATQMYQLESMIQNGCEVLIVAPIDDSSLETVMQEAKEKNIPVISYDSLIRDVDGLAYYVTFDRYATGQKQGEYIIQQLDLDNTEDSYFFEIVAGPLDDESANLFYEGAMDMLIPYIDAGKLLVPSGQIYMENVAIASESTEAARARFESVVSSYYSEGRIPDVVLAGDDTIALGIINALQDKNIGTWPIITGGGCELENIRHIIAGRQSMSVLNDPRIPADKIVEMVDALIGGKQSQLSDLDTANYDNGKGAVPTYICSPRSIDANNYREILLESGYYQENEL